MRSLDELKCSFAGAADSLPADWFEEKFLDCQAKLEEGNCDPAATLAYAGEMRGLCVAAIVRIRALEDER